MGGKGELDDSLFPQLSKDQSREPFWLFSVCSDRTGASQRDQVDCLDGASDTDGMLTC